MSFQFPAICRCGSFPLSSLLSKVALWTHSPAGVYLTVLKSFFLSLEYFPWVPLPFSPSLSLNPASSVSGCGRQGCPKCSSVNGCGCCWELWFPVPAGWSVVAADGRILACPSGPDYCGWGCVTHKKGMFVLSRGSSQFTDWCKCAKKRLTKA